VLLGDSGGPVGAGPYGAKTATTDTASDKAIMWSVALKPSGANQNPQAAFTSTCSAATCSFDASGSSDADGTIASYAWTFGDGGTGSTQTPGHTYSASGTYNVTLTVTDNSGGTASVTHAVTATVPAGGISFLGSAHSAPGSQTSKSVTVPATAHGGDTMVLVLTSGTSNTWSGPGAGWTQIGTTLTNVSINSSAWVKTASAADPGSPVTVTSPTSGKAILSLGVYSGVSTTQPVDAFARAGDAGGTSHSSPQVTASSGDLVLTYWTDKSAAVTHWTSPGSVTRRDDAYDTGTSGRFSVLLADSGSAVGAGAYGGLTATTDTASDKTAMWTIALSPS
jgi:PKD repeat protein